MALKSFFDNIVGGIKKWATTPKVIDIPSRETEIQQIIEEVRISE